MSTITPPRRRFLTRLRPDRLSFLSGLVLIIGLFSLLQLVSVAVISNTMTQVRQDSAVAEASQRQQALMDQARMEVMNASDKLNRAGIYLLFDKETGSVGSWNSLMDEAETSLKHAQETYQQLANAPDDEAFTVLKNSYQQLYNGLAELAQGIKKSNSTDIFFEVPIQAYQNSFTQNYARYWQEHDARQKQHTQQLLDRLDNAHTLFVVVLGLLLCISVAVWLGVNKVIIRPLSHINAHLRRIASGDLSRPVTAERHTTREIFQLNDNLIQMQNGLVNLINEVRQSVEQMMTQMACVSADNRILSEQAQRQSQDLKATTEHIVQLSQHLEQNTQHTRQAGLHAQETSHIAEQGETMMSDVQNAMREIAGRSKEMSEAIGMIEDVAFQTHILSLNAAIEAAHAGEMGLGFSVVAREVGTLASQSSHSAQNINTLIRQSEHSVVTGAQLVSQLNDSLQEIIQAARGTSTFLNEISEISLQQNDSIHEVTGRVSALNETVRQNAGQVENAAQTFTQLHQQAQALHAAVALFHLPAPENSAPPAAAPHQTSAGMAIHAG